MSGAVAELTARRLDVLLAREQVTGRLPSVVGGVVRDGSLVWTGSVNALEGFETGPDVQYRVRSIPKTLGPILAAQPPNEMAPDLQDLLHGPLPGIRYRDRPPGRLLRASSGP